MRVILVNREPSLWEGGDSRKVAQLLRLLPAYGVDATFRSVLDESIDCDLVHIFHCSFPTSHAAIQQIKRHSHVPVVVSTIYSGESIPRAKQQAVIDHAAALICLSPGEGEYIAKRLFMDLRKVRFICNGVDPMFDVAPAEGKYVLCVGRIQEQKNQLQLALAARCLGLRLICVGQILDSNYAAAVEAAGAEILPNREQHALIQLYQHAQVLACVSTHEVHPNVVLEGGLAGLNIVLTSTSLSFTDRLPNVWLCGLSANEIAAPLAAAWNSPKDSRLKSLFKGRTWHKTAKEHADLYQHVLAIRNSPTPHSRPMAIREIL